LFQCAKCSWFWSVTVFCPTARRQMTCSTIGTWRSPFCRSSSANPPTNKMVVKPHANR
jgi:hypothetical protein